MQPKFRIPLVGYSLNLVKFDRFNRERCFQLSHHQSGNTFVFHAPIREHFEQ